MRSFPARLPRPRWFGLLVGMAVVGLLVPPAVRAHAELIQATPTPNSTLAGPPDEVTIAFTEPIDPDAAFIHLLDRSQLRVDGVGAVEVDAGGRVARASLPALEPGTYTVAYQVISAVDGHATTGQYAFLIDPTGTAAPPTTPVTATSPSVDGQTVAARWVALLGLLVAFGSLVGWWRGRPVIAEWLPVGSTGPPWRLVAVGAATAALGVIAYLWLAARPIVDVIGLDDAGFGLDIAGAFGWSPFAIAMRVVAVATVVTAVLAVLARNRADARCVGVAAVLLAASLAGMSVAAHAASYGGPAFAAIDWLHLVAVAAWLGALPALLVLAGRARGSEVGMRATGAALLRGHGRLAILAAPVVALTGIANSPLVLGTSRDLVASDYGNLVLAKATLLAVAVGIGAVNHLALRGCGRAAVVGLVAIELAVAAIAVGVAATMVTIQPAAARPPIVTAPPVNPAHLFGEVGESDVHATVNPPAPGQQAIQVSITERDTGLPRADVAEVVVELHPPPDSGFAPTFVTLHEAESVPGLFGASGTLTPVTGDWGLALDVRLDDGTDERLAFDLPVADPPPAEPVPPRATGIDVPAPIAMTWSVLPRGPVAWLVLALVLGLFAVAARLPPSTGRTLARLGLVTVALVVGAGVTTRTIVDAANRPTGETVPTPPPSAAITDIGRGEGIFLANCASCHGRDGAGDGPIVTTPAAGDLADAVRRTTAADLSYRIAYGVAGTPMPAFAGTLTQDERWALVAYLRDRWAAP